MIRNPTTTVRGAQVANDLVLSDKAKERVHALEQKMAVK